MLAAFVQAAEEAAEPSKTLFYVLAGALVVFAGLLSAVGTAHAETFPPSKGVARLLMLVCALLVAGTMASAVITA